MNVFCGALLVLVVAYVFFLCLSACQLMGASARAANPTLLLSAVARARRHYGTQAVASLIAAAVLGITKGVLALMGVYQNPGIFTRLALGDISGSGGVFNALGIVVVLLAGTALIQSLFFIRYDAYLRMIYTLRDFLKLDLRLTSDKETGE